MEQSTQQSDLEAFTDLLKTGAGTPVAVFVGIALAFTLGVQLIAGLLVAIATTGSSYIDVGDQTSLLTETFHQAAAFTQASFQSDDFGGFSIATMPLVFSLVPAGSVWLAFRLFGERLRGANRQAALVAAGVLCLGFALGVTVFAAIGGDIESDELHLSLSEGDVFLLALFWAALGTAVALVRLYGLPQAPAATPPQARGVARLAVTCLRPLAALLAVCAVIGTVAWEVQIVRDVGANEAAELSVRGERSLPGAVFETALYAPDIGVHFASLGAMAAFHNSVFPGGLAFPVTKIGELIDVEEGDFAEGLEGEQAALSGLFETPGTYRIWDYSDPLPALAFVGLLALVPLVLFFWAYAGFITARRGEPDRPLIAAALGALIGPVLGLAMVALNALTQNFVYGSGDGGSVFLMFTFAGAAVGALGGLLATRIAPSPDAGSS